MPRGYRCIIIALVGVALAAAAQQPTKQHHGNQGADKSETTKPPEPPYSPYPDQNADACYRAQNHDAADLCAQWRAAIAAEKAAIAGNAVHTHFCATERRREVNQDGEGEEPLEDDGDHESEPDSPEE